MTMSSLIRFVQALVLTAAVAALATPAVALAGSSGSKSAPDLFERYAAAHTYGKGVLDQHARVLIDGRSPDTLDAAHSLQTRVTDGRSPDTLDAAYDAQQRSLVPIDGRSPDTLDAGQSPQPVLSALASGFDWGDAGVGAGFATAVLALLSATGALWMRRRPRHQMQTT
jgi:hypothetical protein